MKFRLIALAALAAVGSAQAASLSPTAIDNNRGGSLKEVRIYGASAQTPGLAAYMKDVCGTALDTYKNTAGDMLAYGCVTEKAAGYPIGTQLLVVKRDRGGSVYGVTPVSSQLAQKSLLVNIANCGSGYSAGGTTVCGTDDTVLQTAVPDAGMSDVEPSMFIKSFTVNGAKGVYLNLPNTGADDSGNAWTPPPALSKSLDVKAVGQTVFGLAVSPALYAKLQTAQGTAGAPSIGRAQAAAILSGFVRSTAAGSIPGTSLPFAHWSALTGDAADDSKVVTVCRRTWGSGTQATSNLFFLRAGELTDTSAGMLAPLASTLAANLYDTTKAGLQVFEGDGTGKVTGCLTSPNGDASGYAVGVVTGEKDDTGTAWKFVAIDGAYPDLGSKAAHAGSYDFVYTSSMQWLSKGGPDAAMISFLQDVRTKVASPTYLATAPVTPRLMALPSNWGGNTGTCANQAPSSVTIGSQNVSAYFGSCVERVDLGSFYNPAKEIYGAKNAYVTNSAESLHLVK